ncbi:TOBE domain-containing protein [Sulfurimonas sp. HSL1-2]|uniref:TOBE domain-containing protein n=1 Tax=Thiomicrolovo zhangzhouensis TaxID=3131933 RepID=UPI0031F75946
MKTSARNQIKGTVTEVIGGAVNSEVVMDVAGTPLKAIITKEAVTDMGLAAGSEVYAIIKASFVMIAKEKPGKISTRNVIETTVSDIIEGPVSCELKLAMGGTTLTAIITEEAAKDLGVAKGDTVYALVKASSIILAQ